MMSRTRQRILYLTLGFLCLSLVLPGLWEVFRSNPGHPDLIARHVDALNQLRAYNGMMVAVGCLAGLALFNLEHSRTLIIALSIILLFLASARLVSLLIDGMPGPMTLMYLAIEGLLSVILFVLKPPKR